MSKEKYEGYKNAKVIKKNMKKEYLTCYRFIVYREYLGTNIYYVTQCISTRRHEYHALTVLLTINRSSLFLLTCPQTDNSHK